MPIRFSDAMRAGAVRTGQAFAMAYLNDANSLKYTCAGGAVMFGLYGRVPFDMYADLAELYPNVISAPAKCPIGNCPVEVSEIFTNQPAFTVGNIVIHLNDAHKMPRMDIADWIDSLGLEPVSEIPAISELKLVNA